MSKQTNSGGDSDAVEQRQSASGLPRRAIPGSCGVRFLSPLRDRLDYYYFQGQEEYFRARIARHGGATVLRLNMPPGPFLTGESRVVALLDARSFRVLLDSSKVDKTDTLDGTFVPPLGLFGGFRPLAFLDTAEQRHGALKEMVIRLAAARKHDVVPAFQAAFTAMFDAIEADLAASGQVEYNKHNMSHMLDFTCCALFGGEPPSKAIGPTAAAKAMKWLLFQLHPLVNKTIRPWPLEDLLLHTFHLPPFLVRGDYAALKAYFSAAASAVLDDAEKDLGIPRDEVLHNLIFVALFNAYGGFKIFLPHLLKWLAHGGRALHAKLTNEVRALGGGELSIASLERMPLVKSVVWEALRMNPPVEFQYGRARHDLVIESHDASYEVRKGEMLFGYQPFATRDERVFDRGGEFVAERFVGEDAQGRLLDYVVWSNGPETGMAGPGNKQCPGKDMVVAVGRLIVAELFRRYDTFEADVGVVPLEPKITIRSLTKATNCS